jgi:thiol-disulfide isomerase/thioredoxin
MRKLFSILIFIIFLCFHNIAQAQAIKVWKLKDMDSIITNVNKPTIFNFWATFCKPCIEELPYFQKLAKKYDSAGLQLILVSLDAKEMYPKKIEAFIKRFKITAPVVFLDETNADKFCPVVDERWSGAIPASLFVNNATGYKAFFEEQLTEKQLEKEIQKLIRQK